MSESKLGDMIRASLDGIKDFTDMNTILGNAIHTPGGVTVIPVSKVSIGFANGGIDFAAKKSASSQSFGCGGGTGVSITPLAFLIIGKNAEVDLVPIAAAESSLGKALSIVEHAPEIINRIRNSLS